MKRSILLFIPLLVISCLSTINVSGQKSDSTKRDLKNTIRINITNPMLFGDQYNVIGYERVFKNNQSFSINFGRFSLPRFISPNTDSLALSNNSSDRGFTAAADYRFYLKKENKYRAPRGVYIGPYYSFNVLERTNMWALNTDDFSGELSTKIRFNANLIGAQLGYQFVIKNRFTIDMIIFGPGTWFYTVKTTIDTSLSDEDEELLFDKINEILAEKIPGKDIVVEPGELVLKSGVVTAASAGFRYLINIGFRF